MFLGSLIRPIERRGWFIFIFCFCSVMSNSVRIHGLQHARPPCPSPSPGVCPSSCSLHLWSHPTISSFAALFSCPQSFPASVSFSNESVLFIRWPKFWSFSFTISLSRLTGLILLGGYFQESSPAPQFKGISSLVFYLLNGPALATVCDHWERHSLDYTDLCQQSNAPALQHAI